MKRHFSLFFAVLFLASCGADISKNKDTNETSVTQESIIVPYVEKSKTYYSEYGIKSIVNSYGFCNLNGDVVIEPSDDISTLNCYETDDGFSFYVVGLGQSKQSTYANGFDPMKTLIIPASGEWCVELDEVGWWTISAGDGAIFASLDAACGTRIIEEKTLIYDYNGNLIKEFGPSSYVSEYSESHKDCVQISLLADYPDKAETIYVNSKGNIVEEPKKNGHEFNECGVKISTDEHGFILENDKGHMLTETSFEELKYISNDDDTNGLFVAKMQATNDLYQYFFFSDDGSGVSAGNKVYSKYDIELFFPDSGDIICKYFADDGIIEDAVIFQNLSDGKSVYEDHSGRSGYYESTDNLIIQSADTYGGGYGRILDYTGKELAYFDDFYEFDDISDNGKFVTYTSCANYYDIFNDDYSVERDERKTYIYDVVNAEPLYSIHGNSSTSFVGNDDRFVRYYNHTAEEGGNVYNFGLYDTKKSKLVVENAEDIRHFTAGGNDYFAVSYKNRAYLYDSEMNEIITNYYE